MADYQLQDYSSDPIGIFSVRYACHILALSSIKHCHRTKHRWNWYTISPSHWKLTKRA